MIGSVFNALLVHEYLERVRDRWIILISILFAALGAGVSLYSQNLEGMDSVQIAGPSLVTLATLFVPLVALILGHDAIVGERERNTLSLLLSLPISRTGLVVAKMLGRTAALCTSIVVGLGGAMMLTAADGRGQILALMVPTILLGIAFLSMGVAISAIARRVTVAVNVAVALWFIFVFFFDLGLLELMVITEGAISKELIHYLVLSNPAGLYRLEMLTYYNADIFTNEMGISIVMPSQAIRLLIWLLWAVVPLAIASLVMQKRQSFR
jgi:Cu-processing system permease protein